MASLYQQPKSPFWWVKFRDPKSGKVRRESTGLRVGEGAQTKRARQLCAEKSVAENQPGAAMTGGPAKERWGNWVRHWLLTRYGKRCRFDIAWDTIELFLEDNEVLAPRHLIREHCLRYVEWRRTPDVRRGKYAAGLNTAILEIKALGIVMKEAMARGFAQFNPCRELGLKRERHREKPEFTDGDFGIIQEAINQEADEGLRTFFANSMAIARYQGCRLSETWLNPMDAVRLDGDGGTIAFKAKGSRIHIAPLHPALAPLFRALIDAGKRETYARPKSPARMWFNLLTRCGLKARKPGCCFHSFRVTVATRMARSGKVSEAKAMKFIGHASSTVHRTYQRLQLEDLGECLEAVN